MVKRQKEKQYLSSREQKAQGRSRSNTSQSDPSSSGAVQKSLPFKYCALTLVPFENPACTVFESKTNSTNENNSGKKQSVTKYGIVFDSAALTEFVWKNKKDPVTGNALTSTKIIKLNMDKDSETGQWQCPVLTKAFSDHNTKIVAVISPSGGNEANVYSYEAYHELNVKPKSYVDLTTGLKFHPKKDVLILNDPENDAFQKTIRDVSNFWHIQNARKTGNRKPTNANSSSDNIRNSVTATRVMEELQKNRLEKEEKERKAAEKAAKQKKAAASKDSDQEFAFEIPGSELPFPIPTEDVTGVKYSSGSAALGLTSTSSGGGSTSELRAATTEEILRSRFKLMSSKAWKGKKGYVNLVVEIRRGHQQAPLTLPLLLELHCDMAPRTCSNFLGLCRKKRYDGAIFHRLIEDFMIQGGGEKLKQQLGSQKPTGKSASNNKDTSLWGADGFQDEFDDRLKHVEGGGVLAMANAGPNTNKQQFYITLDKACPHLDRKHSVFGTIAKGMDAFRKALMEEVRTDSKDRPYLETFDKTNGETTVSNAVVIILATEVLEDPSRVAQESEAKRLKELHDLRDAKNKKRKRMVGGDNSSSKNHDTKESLPRAESLGIGRYISKTASNTTSQKDYKPETSFMGDSLHGIKASPLPSPGLPDIGTIAPTTKKTKTKKTKFGNFSSW